MKALDEIYKIYRLLHRSNLQISTKKSSDFFKMNVHFSNCRVFQNASPTNVAIFTLNLDEMLSEFRDTSQKIKKYIQICKHVAKSCAQFPEVSKIAEIVHSQK